MKYRLLIIILFHFMTLLRLYSQEIEVETMLGLSQVKSNIRTQYLNLNNELVDIKNSYRSKRGLSYGIGCILGFRLNEKFKLISSMSVISKEYSYEIFRFNSYRKIKSIANRASITISQGFRYSLSDNKQTSLLSNSFLESRYLLDYKLSMKYKYDELDNIEDLIFKPNSVIHYILFGFGKNYEKIGIHYNFYLNINNYNSTNDRTHHQLNSHLITVSFKINS